MTFSKVLLFPFRVLDRLNPLAAAEGYLLRNHPTLWRASLLKVVWYVMLAHPVLWLLGWVTSQSMTYVPTSVELYAASSWMIPLAIVIGLGWVFSVFQTPMIKRTWGAIGTTLAVYTFFLFGLVTLPAAYYAPLELKVSQIYDRSTLGHDRQAVMRPLDHMCRDNPKVDTVAAFKRLYGDRAYAHEVIGLLLIHRAVILDCDSLGRDAARMLPYNQAISLDHLLQLTLVNTLYSPEISFDLPRNWWAHLSEVEYSFVQFMSNSHFAQSGETTISPSDRDWSDVARHFASEPLKLESYYRDEVNIDDTLAGVISTINMRGQLSAIDAAHKSYRRHHSSRYAEKLWDLVGLAVAAIVALILLTAELNRQRFEQARAGVRRKLGRDGDRKPGVISRLNNRLLRTRPALWQMRMPAAFLTFGIVLSFGWFALNFSEWLFDEVEARFASDMDGDMFAIAFAITYGLTLTSCGVLLMMAQRRYFSLDTRSPGAALRFFLALFLPPFAACSLGFGLHFISSNGDPSSSVIVWAFAAIVAYIGSVFSWSMTFLGVRKAFVQIAVSAGITSAVIFLIVTLGWSETQFEMFLALPWLIVLILLWPAHWVGLTDKISVSIVITVILYSSWVGSIMLLFVLEMFLSSGINGDAEATPIILFGMLFIVVLIIPLLSRMQAITNEPRDA